MANGLQKNELSDGIKLPEGYSNSSSGLLLHNDINTYIIIVSLCSNLAIIEAIIIATYNINITIEGAQQT